MTTDSAVFTRYPKVNEFHCPYCGHLLGYLVDVNGDEWVRDLRSGWMHRNTVGICPHCLMLVKYRSPNGRR